MASIYDYSVATAHLAGLDDDWACLVTKVGTCTHLPRPELSPYQSLVRTIAFQQLHGRAAEAILGRMLSLFKGRFPSPAQLLILENETLRTCGFSARKILTLKAIAEAALAGVIPTRARAKKMSDEDLIERLIALPGVGRWTVEMLLIYSLERMDIFPVDDFGVREGYRLIKSLDKQLTPKAMRDISLSCSPYRTVAAWYLWRALELPEYKLRK